MPLNKNKKCCNQNLGYVFITMRNASAANEFKYIFDGFQFAGSERPCRVRVDHGRNHNSSNEKTDGVFNKPEPTTHAQSTQSPETLVCLATSMHEPQGDGHHGMVVRPHLFRCITIAFSTRPGVAAR
mmetsp:Transcript_28015/g.51140  ORF Transcript_28015/g.51140 Transcript_28015/m.51140 type:complete len:127 (+) Transcript_28015:239-619(+)